MQKAFELEKPAAEALRSGQREVIRAAIAADPSRMTIAIARELGVPEVDVIAALPGERAIELDAARWRELIEGFAALGNVHVISSNNTVTLEAFGTFGGFSTWGEYFNVQTKTLDMHIRFDRLQRIFAIIKPGHLDGVLTFSFQFYDRDGSAAFKVFLTFGGKAPSPEKTSAFETICERFRLPARAQ